MSAVRESDGEVHFSLKYGDGLVEVKLPRENLGFFIEPHPVTPIEDLQSALDSAVNNPISSPPLREIIKPSDKVVVVASDITSLTVRCDILVPFVLSKLYEYGVPDQNITILLGLGTHRPHTPEEQTRIVGKDGFRRHRVVDHDCYDPVGCVRLGTTSRGTPVAINRIVVEADKVILTGGIDFHALAGFGGGRKALCPGVASIETIQANHKMALGQGMHEALNPACGPGRVAGNPVAEDMDEIAAMVGPHFLLNTIVNPDARIVDLVSGHWRDAFAAGREKVRELYSVPIPEKADAIIVSSGGFPKDINMWQSVRAIHAAASAVKENAPIVLIAEARDGAGNPEFEKWFEYPSPEAIRKQLAQDFHLPGSVAMRLLDVAGRHPTYILSSISDELAQRMHLRKVKSVDEAIELVRKQQGTNVRFAVMPYGKASIPVLSA